MSKCTMTITHVQSGRTWSGEATELTAEELEIINQGMKDNISSLNYIELAGTILPGDFVRNHCIIFIG